MLTMADYLGNGLFDIPDYQHLEDETFPPLPPPHSPGQGGRDDQDPFSNEDDGELSKLKEVPSAKERRTVKRPQPKLDSQRLISERGLPALRTLFDNVRFKGKGHETEDLRVLMQKMENWAHRLYPKLQFEDFMDKVEKLGAKKEVQTCLKRIRLDMPLTHEDFISKDGEEEITPVRNVFEDPDPFGSGGDFTGNSQGPIHSTPAPTSTSVLTEEQRRRIELNKQLAMERRLARKQQPPHTELLDSQTVSSASSAHQPSASPPPTEPCPSMTLLEETGDLDLDQDPIRSRADQKDTKDSKTKDSPHSPKFVDEKAGLPEPQLNDGFKDSD